MPTVRHHPARRRGLRAAPPYDRAADRTEAADRARALLPKVAAWHRWFYATRDPAREGLVAIIHPWESGRDNSIDWDEPFARVPTEGIAPYTRRDTQHADPEHRPTKDRYDRYLWLVEHFRGLAWDTSMLHDASPFRVVDPGFNAILIRSAPTSPTSPTPGRDGDRRREPRLRRTRDGGDGKPLVRTARAIPLPRPCYRPLIDSPSVGGLLAAFAPIPAHRAARIAATIEGHGIRFRVASHAPDDPRFQAKRYWRGPSWLVVNYMIGDGLARAGQTDAAEAITPPRLDLIRTSGFAEYYDPQTGEPLGGGRFTWTAAMVLEFLAMAD